MKSLAEDEIASLLLRHSLIHRVGLRGLLWLAEEFGLLGKVGGADGFRYKRRALIYEQLAEVVDTDLIREVVCVPLGMDRTTFDRAIAMT